MRRLEAHLNHILEEVVPQRRAAQEGLPEGYLVALAERPQPPLLVRGLEQWNGGWLYAQHETLEWLWRATDEPVRDLWKGIIQGGVGTYHVLNRNRRGALAKWTGASLYLVPFEAGQPYGIGVATLRAQLLEAREALLQDEEGRDWEGHAARAEGMRIPWEPRLAQPRVTDLLRRLDLAWEEGRQPLMRVLEGLSDDEATWVADERIGTILARLVALGEAMGETGQQCFGIAPAATPPPTAEATLAWLTTGHEALRHRLGFLDDPALDHPTGPAGEPLQALLDAAIARTLRAARDLALLRGMWRKG